MTFETKLKQIIEQLRILFAKDEYKQEVEQYLAKKLLGDHFKWDDEDEKMRDLNIRRHGFSGAYLKLSIPGYDLRKIFHRREQVPRVYVDGDGNKIEPPKKPDHGYIDVDLEFDKESINKMALTFSPGLTIPLEFDFEFNWNRYDAETKKAKATFRRNGKGVYHLKENDKDVVEFYIYPGNERVGWIRFKPELIGKGVITYFFEDMKYDGLERLLS